MSTTYICHLRDQRDNSDFLTDTLIGATLADTLDCALRLTSPMGAKFQLVGCLRLEMTTGAPPRVIDVTEDLHAEISAYERRAADDGRPARDRRPPRPPPARAGFGGRRIARSQGFETG